MLIVAPKKVTTFYDYYYYCDVFSVKRKIWTFEVRGGLKR